jgi:hypothetical protein
VIAQVIAARHPPVVPIRLAADTTGSSCALSGIPIAWVLTDPRYLNGRFTKYAAATARQEKSLRALRSDESRTMPK